MKHQALILVTFALLALGTVKLPGRCAEKGVLEANVPNATEQPARATGSPASHYVPDSWLYGIN